MVRVRLAVAALGLVAGCTLSRTRPAATGVVEYPTLEADGTIDPYAGREADASSVPAAAERTVGDDIPVDYDIGDPRDVQAMVVHVRTHDYALPSGPNQRVVREAGRVQRVLVRAAAGAAVTTADRKAALEGTDTIDAGHAAIHGAALAATRGERGVRNRVGSLVKWIYSHVSYELGDETVASRVLARGTGDCSELSLLFVAMARSVGIPARRVVGLAATYSGGGPAFGYHAWAEAAIDGHWVQVDPTWNEELADATHIALLQGEGDDWGRAAVALTITVLDVTRSPGAYDSDPRQLVRELPVFLRLRPRP